MGIIGFIFLLSQIKNRKNGLEMLGFLNITLLPNVVIVAFLLC